jgi:hypothetical protein
MTAAAAVAAVWPSWRATTRAWRPDADLRTALWIWLGSAGVLLLAHDPLYLQHLMVVVPPASILLAAHRPPALVAVAVLLATLPLQADGAGWRASRRQPSPSEATVIDLLVRLAPADGLVISDEPALPWLAGRTSPGSMVDLSYVRIESGDLDADDLLAAAHRPGVCAVLIWTPRLAQLPGQRAALEDYRPVFHSVERVLLVRDGCTIQPHPDRRLLRLGYSI